MENINLNLLVSCFFSKLWNCSVHGPSFPKHIKTHLSLLLPQFLQCKKNKPCGCWTGLLFIFWVLTWFRNFITWVWFLGGLHALLHSPNPNLTTVFLLKGNFLEAQLRTIPLEADLEVRRKLHSHFCSVLFIWANTPASTSALEATTCGSTQPVLMKEPQGRHYNKSGQSRGAVLLSLLARLNTGPLFRCTW